MRYGDYLVAVDESGQPYIAHRQVYGTDASGPRGGGRWATFRERASNIVGNIRNRAHKYSRKERTSYGWRYYYDKWSSGAKNAKDNAVQKVTDTINSHRGGYSQHAQDEYAKALHRMRSQPDYTNLSSTSKKYKKAEKALKEYKEAVDAYAEYTAYRQSLKLGQRALSSISAADEYDRLANNILTKKKRYEKAYARYEKQLTKKNAKYLKRQARRDRAKNFVHTLNSRRK